MKISLLAFNKCEFQSYNTMVGFGTTTEIGTWTYDDESQMITIYHAQEWLKELKEKDSEAYEGFSSPEKLEWLTFKVAGLSKNQMHVE
ncbi:hypothetical protein [Maribacter sp. 2308TA10-17]|uniref:hypothetical protein n=1 Tax=Maribacter sp. 2308TA10-17 TaxID=3386276 RepID=UPI0039BC2CA2